MLAFVGDFVPETITGIFTYNKCSSYRRDDVSPWFKFMSDLLSSFWQISQVTKSHGFHEWPVRCTLMGHTWLPLLGPMGTCNKLPRGARVLVPHRAPDSKIQWAPWMANEGQSHGQHMGCQWCGPWGLATCCHVGTTYLALLMPIWASMGPMYICHHSANKIPWAPWGACVCLSKHHHGWSQRSPQRECSGKAR